MAPRPSHPPVARKRGPKLASGANWLRDQHVGLLVGAVFCATQEALRRPAAELFGEEDAGGTPRWRNALVLFPQLVGMSSLCLAAKLDHGWSLRRWCEDCKSSGMCAKSYAIVYVFLAYLFTDMLYWYLMPPPPVIMRDLMVVHHVVCICGTLYATQGFCVQAATPSFIEGVCVLEFGSACSNLFALYRNDDSAELVLRVKQLYFLGMCFSNSYGAYCTTAWYQRQTEGGASRWAVWLPIVLWIALLVLRQEALHKLAGPTTW